MLTIDYLYNNCVFQLNVCQQNWNLNWHEISHLSFYKFYSSNELMQIFNKYYKVKISLITI